MSDDPTVEQMMDDVEMLRETLIMRVERSIQPNQKADFETWKAKFRGVFNGTATKEESIQSLEKLKRRKQ